MLFVSTQTTSFHRVRKSLVKTQATALRRQLSLVKQQRTEAVIENIGRSLAKNTAGVNCETTFSIYTDKKTLAAVCKTLTTVLNFPTVFLV